ncbi:hypothetical protein CsSME_00023821 [Camellia sinensis var. sinensis]
MQDGDRFWRMPECYIPGNTINIYDTFRDVVAEATGENRQLWNEIANEICKNADRLYRMIAEAFGVLSEPTKRYVYDLKEERRNAQENSNGGKTLYWNFSPSF